MCQQICRSAARIRLWIMWKFQFVFGGTFEFMGSVVLWSNAWGSVGVRCWMLAWMAHDVEITEATTWVALTLSTEEGYGKFYVQSVKQVAHVLKCYVTNIFGFEKVSVCIYHQTDMLRFGIEDNMWATSSTNMHTIRQRFNIVLDHILQHYLVDRYSLWGNPFRLRSWIVFGAIA